MATYSWLGGRVEGQRQDVPYETSFVVQFLDSRKDDQGHDRPALIDQMMRQARRAVNGLEQSAECSGSLEVCLEGKSNE